MIVRFAQLSAFAAALLVAGSSSAAPMEVAPSTVTVVYGKVLSGTAHSLAFDDGETLNICKFFVPNVPVDPVTFRVETNLPMDASSLAFHITGRAVNFGTYTQSLNLFDWNRGVFDPSTNVTSPLTRAASEMVCFNQGDVSKYVRSTDRRVWALVRVRATGFTPVNNWQAEYERAWFEFETPV